MNLTHLLLPTNALCLVLEQKDLLNKQFWRFLGIDSLAVKDLTCLNLLYALTSFFDRSECKSKVGRVKYLAREVAGTRADSETQNHVLLLIKSRFRRPSPDCISLRRTAV